MARRLPCGNGSPATPPALPRVPAAAWYSSAAGACREALAHIAALTGGGGLHDRMVDAMGNDIVSDMYRVNSLRVRLIKLEHSVITPTRLMPAMQEHLRFIAALRQRDGARAVELLMAHINSARNRVLTEPMEQVRSEWTLPPVELN